MKILVNIGHPADVHLFKHFIWNMKRKGHQVLICAVEKDVALNLLDAYGFEYVQIGKSYKNPLAKIINLGIQDIGLWQIARKFKPDILIGLGSITSAHVSVLLRKPYITFQDTEHQKEQYYLYAPFSNVICTPSCFKRVLGKKQLRFNGYKELAYLHPNHFKPNRSVLDELGLNENEKFIIIRFVAWHATHDIGQHGFDLQSKKKLVENLGKHARVFITSEGPLPREFETYRVKINPEKMHDLLYYAAMYIGEGSTMATEAAVLGTPSLYISTLSKYLGYCIELEEQYGLLYRFLEAENAVRTAEKLIQQPNLKEQWAMKRQKLLEDKIDVAEFMTNFIENYPESFQRYQKKKKLIPKLVQPFNPVENQQSWHFTKNK